MLLWVLNLGFAASSAPTIISGLISVQYEADVLIQGTDADCPLRYEADVTVSGNSSIGV